MKPVTLVPFFLEDGRPPMTDTTSLSKYPAIQINRLQGTERFSIASLPLQAEVLGFWQWSCSNLLGNTLRGQLAEYIVGLVLGCVDEVRQEWDAHDLVWSDDCGEPVRIEVKSAAYLQSWHQEAHSVISFDIAKKKSWDAATNTYCEAPSRASHVYVFCLLHHHDKATVNPLDLSQWSFYAVSTQRINERFPNQQRIAIGPLGQLHGPPFSFVDLPTRIRAAKAAVDLRS